MPERRFDVLFPPGAPATAAELTDGLAAQGGGARPRVLANMVASVDGRTAVGGRSDPLGGPGDHALFHALRGVVDGVLVGTGTLRTEQYGRLVRGPERRARRAALGLAEDAVAVTVTRSGDVPWDIGLFGAPEQVVVVGAPPGAVRVPAEVRARVIVVELEDPAPGAVLEAAAREQGLRTVLCEGGPALLAALVEDDLVDELFLTLGPLVAGGGDDVPRLLAGIELATPLPLSLRWVLRDGDELLLRYGRDR